MQAVGRQLADRLDPGRLHFGTPVHTVAPGSVEADGRRVRADAVVVATDPVTADRLLPGLGRDRTPAGDHALPRAAGVPLGPAADRPGHTRRPARQQRRRLRRAAGRYSPDGRALVGELHTGADERDGRPCRDRRGARRRSRRARASHLRHRRRCPAGSAATTATSGGPSNWATACTSAGTTETPRPSRAPWPAAPGRRARCCARCARPTDPPEEPPDARVRTHDPRHQHGLREPQPRPVRLAPRPGLRPGLRARRSAPSGPRLCYLGTATGDDPARVAGVYGAFAGSAVQVSHLSLFTMPTVRRRPRPPARPGRRSGSAAGSVANLLAVWRVHGLDEVFARGAGRPASCSAGVSAGSLCWHVGGTDRLLRPRPAPGHQRPGPDPDVATASTTTPRSSAGRCYHRLVADGTLPAGARHRRRRRPAVPRHRAGRGGRRPARTSPPTGWSAVPDGAAVETRIEPRRLRRRARLGWAP